MLSDRATLKQFLRLGSNDTSQDNLLDLLLVIADRAVKLWTKRDLETSVYTEYKNGTGTQRLVLKHRPVRSYRLTGTLSSGSTTVSGLSSTTNLSVGMPAIATGIPAGTTVASIPSSTSVALSQAATASGSASILFGIACWLDAAGYYGDGTGAFASTTQLTLGSDYGLERDDNGLSQSGILVRLSGGPSGAVVDWPWGWRKGTLTARMPPAWTEGMGNIKVVYAAGLGAGASEGSSLPATTTLPKELTFATNAIAAFLRAVTPAGVPVQMDEMVTQVSTLLDHPSPQEAPEIGTARGILRSYREMTF